MRCCAATRPGRFTRAELEGRANAGEVGPRTYLWREGMDSWQRAKDVPELAFLFPQPAAAPRRFSAPPIAAPESSAPPPLPAKPVAAPEPAAANDAQDLAQAADATDERVHQEDVARNLFTPAETPALHEAPTDLAGWAGDELAKKRDAEAKQAKAGSPSRMFEGAAPPESRGPFAVFIVLMALAIAAAVLWAVLFREKTVEARPDAGQTQQEPAPDSGKLAAAKPQPVPAEPPAPAHATAPPPFVPVAGLTAEQVRKKLDEHKPALRAAWTPRSAAIPI